MLGTICQVCHKRPATAHLTELGQPGQVAELHICAHCIKRLGLDLHRNPPRVAKVLAQEESAITASASGEGPQPRATTADEATCFHCGMAWSEFTSDNRFGCAHDVNVFGNALVARLAGIHGAHRHQGRGPGQEADDDGLAIERRRLERDLQRAIAAEDYERAAILRDRLHQLGEGGAQ